MNWIISFLNLFGITSDKYPFLVLGVITVAGIGHVHFSIGGKLERMKDNMLIIIAHLSTDVASRGKLDTNLIQIMSPLSVTSRGYEMLLDSGFTTIFDTPEYRAQFISSLQSQNPRTKLDVENFSIVSFAMFFEKDFMNPIKTYLFNNPAARESYQTLAGLYIRDQYLKDHPEITQ